MDPPGLLAPDAPDASLAGEVPTAWVPGGREATAPREPCPLRNHTSWSHASRKSRNQKLCLLEAPSGGLGRSRFPGGHLWCQPGPQAGLLGGEKRLGGLRPYLSWGLGQLQ